MNKQMTRTLSVAVAIAGTAFALAGCAGGSGVGTPPTQTTQTASNSARQAAGHPSAALAGLVTWKPDRARSWMKASAAGQTLLYVSDIGTGSVTVFTYPKGNLVGTITGFGYPQGLCSDSFGNVYVADGGNRTISEFAHGGTTPIAVFDDPGAWPASCAVDPTTGNLAVANLLTDQNFNAGNVLVFPPGSSTGTTYADTTITREYFLDYDLSGNVYVAGVGGSTNQFRFTEMTPDGNFTQVPVKNGTIGFAGGVQRYGSDFAVVDQQGSTFGKPDVYRIATSGKVVGKTTLVTSTGGRLIDPVQFVIVPKNSNKNYIVTADALGGAVYQNAFPNGKYSASYTTNLVQPLGVALSNASTH